MNVASSLGEGAEAPPRLSAVSHPLRNFLKQPQFLARHLSPRPFSPIDDLVDTLIVQPRRGLGYSPVTLVSTDRAGSTINDEGLRTAGSGDVSPEPAARAAASDLINDEGLRTAGSGDVSPEQAARAAASDFFERTMPMLDIAIVAAHGRLLLGRSRDRYFVCDPSANRWLALPPSTTAPERDAASGIHYHFDEASGKLCFQVVILVRIKHRRVRVETFASETGTWGAEDLVAQGAARCLGVVTPGIYVGTSFYWKSRALSSDVRYDVKTGRASVVREPPKAMGSFQRLGRSLGSAGGRLRMSALDIRDSILSEEPEGVHSVWMMDAAGPPWKRVHEAVLYDLDTPVDFVGASADFIVVRRDRCLLRYDLVTGVKQELADLPDIALYSSFHVYPLFRSYQVAGPGGDEALKTLPEERTYPVYRERLESSKNTFKGKIVYKPGRRPVFLEDGAGARADASDKHQDPPTVSYSYRSEKDVIKKSIKTVKNKIQEEDSGKYRKKLGRGVTYLTSLDDRLSAEGEY